LKREVLERILARRDDRKPVVLVTRLDGGAQELLDPDDPGARADAELLDAAREALRRDRCILRRDAGDRLFLQPFNAPLRMIVVGAVHIAQPLSWMAAESGYDVSVIDPRTAFASPERFPQVKISHAWPDEALRELALDARSAVVTLTHDPKLDDPALDEALRSDAFYVGALGSRRTQAARLERLRERGFDEAALARIHGPIGLDLGAQSPAEIAISILAEVTACLRKADA
jgi:xanthine dehydrogenase accessory factor